MSAAIAAKTMPLRPKTALRKRERIADRYHIGQNLAEAVQLLLARTLTELKQAQDEEAGQQRQQMKASLPITQWRPTPGKDVQQAVARRRAEREHRYQQVAQLRGQGLTSKQIAARMSMNERTLRHWLQRKTAPDVRQRRKYASDFDPYAPYVLQRWKSGCRNGLLMRDFCSSLLEVSKESSRKPLIIAC